jgi:hypothetical protein
MNRRTPDCTSEWGVPDWREETPYRYICGLSADLQRWEFLRRCHSYRRDWNSGNSRCDVEFGLREFVDPKLRGDQLPAAFRFDDSARLGEVPEWYQWGPEDISALNIDETARRVGLEYVAWSEAGFLFLAFDPGRSIDEQLSRARKTLLSAKPKPAPSRGGAERRNIHTLHNRDTIALLRVLDAYNEFGITELVGGTYRTKQDIGTKVFSGSMNDEDINSKVVDRAYVRALRRAMVTGRVADRAENPKKK